MRTITQTVYRFNELGESAQEKALEKYRYTNIDHEWWDSVYEYAYELLTEAGFRDCKIWFSGFACQGDGACFDGSIDTEHFAKTLESGKYLPCLSQGIHFTIDTFGRYSHEHSRKVCNHSSFTETKEMDELITEFADAIEEIRFDLSCRIYLTLEKEHDWLTSDECIKEHFELNDYEFFEDGTMV